MLRNSTGAPATNQEHLAQSSSPGASSQRDSGLLGPPVLWVASAIALGLSTAVTVAIVYVLPFMAVTGIVALLSVGLVAPLLVGPRSMFIVVPLYLFRNPIIMLAIGPDIMHPSTAAVLRMSLAIPDLMILVILGSLLVSQTQPFRLVRLITGLLILAMFIAFISAQFLVSEASLPIRLSYLRSFILPIAIFIGAQWSRDFNVKPELRFLLLQVGLAVVVGAGIYIFNTSGSWVSLGGQYFAFKHGGPDNMLPGIWSTTFFGMRFLRFGGTLLDPIALGYWTLSAVVASIALRRWSLGAFFAVGVFCSLSKGALLGLVIVGLFGFWYLWKGKTPLRLLVLSGAVVVVALLPVLSSEGKGSFWVHFEGAQHGVRAALHTPQGHGLGVGGNWEGIITGTTDLQTGAESGLGVLAFQLGLIGLLSAVGFFTWQVWRRVRRGPLSSPLATFSLGVVVALAVLLAFQENSLSASAAFPLWWLIGRTTPTAL